MANFFGDPNHLNLAPGQITSVNTANTVTWISGNSGSWAPGQTPVGPGYNIQSNVPSGYVGHHIYGHGVSIHQQADGNASFTLPPLEPGATIVCEFTGGSWTISEGLRRESPPVNIAAFSLSEIEEAQETISQLQNK